MIIGDTTTFGGRGISPQLVVTAPAGSTIDVMQNSVVLQTYTLTGSETSHTFYVDRGTYTVRGTLSTQTKSETVNVSSVGIFSVSITYRLYLYNEGDECESVTGGWGKTKTTLTNYWSINGSKNQDTLQFGTSSNYYNCTYIAIYNDIDVSEYSKCCMSFRTFTSSVGTNSDGRYAVYPQVVINGTAYVSNYGYNSPSAISLSNQIIEYDISNASTGEMWIGTLYGWGNSAPLITGLVDKVWLE